jgi:hypothetical protein
MELLRVLCPICSVVIYKLELLCFIKLQMTLIAICYVHKVDKFSFVARLITRKGVPIRMILINKQFVAPRNQIELEL